MLDMHEVTGSIPVVSTKSPKDPGLWGLIIIFIYYLLLFGGELFEKAPEIFQRISERVRFSPPFQDVGGYF